MNYTKGALLRHGKQKCLANTDNLGKMADELSNTLLVER